MTLAYHRIVPESSPYAYSVSCRQLEEHLQVVANFQADSGRATPFPPVTFDDGHRSNHQYAFPLLERRSVRAIFFVTAGWIGNRDEFMGWPELKELTSSGHIVQSHGWSHRILTECSKSELQDELKRSKHTIEDKLGIGIDALSVPHGRWNDGVLEGCARVGYRCVYISDPWTPRSERAGVKLRGRLMVRRSLDAQRLLRLLRGERSVLFLLRSQYGMKEAIKRLLGDRIYHRLWSRLAAVDALD